MAMPWQKMKKNHFNYNYFDEINDIFLKKIIVKSLKLNDNL